jgi:TPR repeat protein
MAAPLEHLGIGSGVEVHGLQARPDLNAKRARVVAYVPERERYHVVILATDEEMYLRRANLTKSAAAAAATAFSYSLMSRGRDTLRAANRGDANSQDEVGHFHMASAIRLDILQGTSADDATVAARWAQALGFMERAAEQSIAGAQSMCGQIYANGDRSVPQNWTTAVKWFCKAAAGGDMGAQWAMGLCYYYGRGVDRDTAQATTWFRKAAAQRFPDAARAVQSGVPGHPAVREVLARFTNAGSTAPLRHAAAHELAGFINERYLGLLLQAYSRVLQEDDSDVPHQSLRDSIWVDFMLFYGLSDEDLELAKRVYAYSLRTSAAPTPPRSKSARCAWSCATASARTANTRTGTRPPRRSRTRCCVPASSSAAARGGLGARRRSRRLLLLLLLLLRANDRTY